jgi:D-glycero-D-manno-heptose 1,7-bisphosphate phosphatase
MQPAIFLDRDGVIIENRPDYVQRWADVQFIPGVLPALARLKDTPYKIVIISNQAGIGRGIITRQVVEDIQERLIHEIIQAGGRIDGVYVCPHKPEDGCTCRKPRPGLILHAAQDLEIDLRHSMMIGDNLSDVQAGLAAGVGQLVFVRTGVGGKFAQDLEAAGFAFVPIYNDLVEALTSLIETHE